MTARPARSRINGTFCDRLGTLGVWYSSRNVTDERTVAEAARCAETLGFGTFWLGASPRLASVRPLLEATEHLVVGTSIVNVWEYQPDELAAEYAGAASDFEDRLVVGIGIGHPETTSRYAKPLTVMRSFLDGLDAADPPLPMERRCLAALAPRMQKLSAERALGAIPYFTTEAHTRTARERLGTSALLAPEIAVVVDRDSSRARARARDYARLYLGRANYRNNLLELGYTEEDMADGGSDRLIDAVVPHGTAEEIAAAARSHLVAGADHVALQVLGGSPVPQAEWEALAAAMG